MAAAIEARAVSKRFGGVEALRGAGFRLEPGQVLALLGANGAGKSTLIQILAGALAPDAGAVEIQGQPLWRPFPEGNAGMDGSGAARARELGVAVIFQDLGLYPNLSVAENIAGDLRAGRLYHPRQVRRAATEALARLNAPLPLDRPAGELAAGYRQLTAIARALARQAGILILDEPTAALAEAEAQRLLELVRRMADSGHAIIFISHRLREIRQIADRFLVLRDGRVVLDRPAAQAGDAVLHQAMFGEAASALAAGDVVNQTAAAPPSAAAFSGKTAATLAGENIAPAPWLVSENAGSAGAFAGVSLQLAPGQVTVLAGMVGAGQSEFARALFGLRRLDRGSFRLRGKTWRPRQPRQALAAGVHYLPADRAGEGLFPSLTVEENLALARLAISKKWPRSLPRLTRFAGLFPRTAAWADAEIAAFGIRCHSRRSLAGSLSGGNQQKLLLAKTLAYSPAEATPAAEVPVLILDEPTAGVDIAAKADMHARIRLLAAEGWAVLVVSSELEEMLALGDRIIIFRAGRLAASLHRGQAERARLIAALVGAGMPDPAALATDGLDLNPQNSEPPLPAGDLPLATSHWPAAPTSPVAGRAPIRERRQISARFRSFRLALARFGHYETGLGLGLAAMLLVAGLAAPRLLSAGSLVSMLRNASVLSILSLGMLMVMLTGGIDISVGAMLAISSVLVAKLAAMGWPAPLALAATLAAGLILGAGNAACIAELGVPPIVATLGTMGLYRGLLLESTGGNWITSLPGWLRALGRPNLFGFDLSVPAAAALAAAVWWLLGRTQPGRNLYRYGGAPRAARRWGVPEKKLLYGVYAGMGFCAALGGIFYVAQLGAAQGNAAVGYELTVIAAVVLGGADILGGRGSVLGTLLGVLLLAVISASLVLLHVPAFWQGVVTGSLVLVGVGAGQFRRARELAR